MVIIIDIRRPSPPLGSRGGPPNSYLRAMWKISNQVEVAEALIFAIALWPKYWAHVMASQCQVCPADDDGTPEAATDAEEPRRFRA